MALKVRVLTRPWGELPHFLQLCLPRCFYALKALTPPCHFNFLDRACHPLECQSLRLPTCLPQPSTALSCPLVVQSRFCQVNQVNFFFFSDASSKPRPYRTMTHLSCSLPSWPNCNFGLTFLGLAHSVPRFSRASLVLLTALGHHSFLCSQHSPPPPPLFLAM